MKELLVLGDKFLIS